MSDKNLRSWSDDLELFLTGLFPISDGENHETVENYGRDTFTTIDASGCFTDANFKTQVRF